MVAAAVGFGGDDEVGLGKLLDRGGESGGVGRKPTMPHGGQEGSGVLPNGGGSQQRERLPFFSSPLFSSFNCHFLSFKTFPLF